MVIILTVVLSIIILLVAVIGLLLHSYINKMNLVPDGDNPVQATNEIPTLVPEPDEVDPNAQDSPKSDIDTLEDNIKNNLEEKSSPIIYNKNVYNILLIGSDTRESGGFGRSDVMILISINKKSKEIIVTSFLRDIYLQIPGKKNNRLNAAYAFGGADLLMDTLEQNFKIKIDQYASFDFYTFIDVVDAIGGVTIDVTEDEIPVMNSYLAEINKLLGDEEGADYLDTPGSLLLNGKQALAYSRNRYVGNGDFARTERQRKVIEQIFLKGKGLNIIKLKGLLDVVLPDITTNLSEGEIFTFLLSAPSYMKYDRLQWSIPESGTYKNMTINKMAVLGIDFEENIKDLQTKIYGEASE